MYKIQTTLYSLLDTIAFLLILFLLPVNTPGQENTPILNSYTDAYAAYSLRKMDSGYTGYAVGVRRSADNAEKSFGFDSEGNLNISDIESWLGASDGYVTTWFSQISGQTDLVQTDKTRQPIIAQNGTVILDEKGLPGILFEGERNSYLTTYPGSLSSIPINNMALMIVGESRTSPETQGVLALQRPGEWGQYKFTLNIQNHALTFRSDITTQIWTGIRKERSVWGINFDNYNTVHCYYNNAETKTEEYSGSVSSDQLTVGVLTKNKDSGFDGYISEILLFPGMTTEEYLDHYDLLNSYWNLAPADYNRSAILPQAHDYQVNLYNWLKTIDTTDVALPTGALDYSASGLSDEKLANLWMLTRELSISRVVRGENRWYVLDDGKGGGIEGTGEVRIYHTPGGSGEDKAWENEIAFWYQFELPNNGSQGNPYYKSRAVGLRALIVAAVDMMMYHEEVKAGTGLARNDQYGKAFASWAYVYYHCKELLDTTTQTAFESGLDTFLGYMIEKGAWDVNTNMDMFSVYAAAYTYASVDNPDIKSRAVQAAKKILLGYTDGELGIKHDVDIGTYFPAGYVGENDGPDTFYNSESYTQILGAYSVTHESAEWSFLDEIIESMTAFRVYQHFREPNETFLGPAGYANRTGAPMIAGQNSPVWRDVVAAHFHRIGKPLLRSAKSKGSSVFPDNGFSYNIGKALDEVSGSIGTVYEGTPPVWTGWESWIKSVPFLPPDGWYSELESSLTNDPNAVYRPFELESSFSKAFGGYPTGNEFWAFQDTDSDGSRFGWFIEADAQQRGYAGWYGGKLEAFWTNHTGMLVLNIHDKTGCDPADPENTVCWDQIDYWAMNHVWGLDDSAVPVGFTTGHVRNEDPIVRNSVVNPDAVIPYALIENHLNDPVKGIDEGQQNQSVLEGTVSITNRFDAEPNGVKVTHTVTSDQTDQVTQLWASIPVFLKSNSYPSGQRSLNDATIEYWDGTSWVSMPEDTNGDGVPELVNTNGIRIGRDFADGVGLRYGYVDFETSQNLRLSTQIYMRTYQVWEGGERVRNIHIDMHGEPGVAKSLPASKSVTYTVQTTDPTVEIEQPQGGDTGGGDTGGGDSGAGNNSVKFAAYNGSDSISVVADSGLSIIDARGIQTPDSEEGFVAAFPYDFSDFSITGLNENSTTVTMTFPEGYTPAGFWNFGPTSDNAEPHWYEFLYDGNTGAEITGNTVTLYLQDGGRGDCDLNLNDTLKISAGTGIYGYDNNADGIPDISQANVTTLDTYDNGNSITFEFQSNLSLNTLQAVEPPGSGDSVYVSQFLFGAFDYECSGLEEGGASQVIMYLPDGSIPPGFWQYGPTPENSQPHWYEFLYDGVTGAEINGNLITIHYQDGARGDHDLATDGKISAISGPGDLYYDGNNDGVADTQQPEVESFSSIDGTSTLTLVTVSGTISTASCSDIPEYPEPDYVSIFPQHFVSGTVEGIQSGETITLTYYLPDSETPESFWMYGPTSQNTEPHWYEFLYDGVNGVEIQNNIVTLHITDGGAGDSDGQADGIITLTGGAGNIYYDGNQDETPDSWQPHVMTLVNSDSQDSILVVAESGTSLENIVLSSVPAAVDQRYLPDFPHGMTEYTISGISTGAPQIVEMTYPPGTDLSEYWMYGPTPDNAEPHWYEFLYDGNTGAEINGNTVNLHLTDGLSGDSDFTGNGTLAIFGGLGQFRYDGNKDKIADIDQSHVASFGMPNSSDSVTVVAQEEATIGTTRFINAPMPGDTSYSADFPLGFFDIELIDIMSGSPQQINIILPEEYNPSSFWMYGPTPDNQTPHWYEFMYDGYTGAEIADSVITLHFIDGKRGDLDLSINGSLFFSGGPGQLIKTDDFAQPIDEQKNILSFQSYDGKHYITIAAPAGTEITGVKSVKDFDSLGDAEPGGLGKVAAQDSEGYLSNMEFPYGFVEFTLSGARDNEIVPVSLYLPQEARPESYFQYGVTPDNPTPHWYEFNYDGWTGAQMRGNVVTLQFVENQRGDGDLSTEQVLSAGGPGYLLFDGNHDGIPDGQQDHVISFRPQTSAEYVTLSGDSTARFTNVRTTDPGLFNPTPPEHLDFFYHLFEYHLSVTESGGASTVTLALPAEMSAEDFYNYGPTPENPEPHWYPFTYDGTTGAEINGNMVTLHFVDGARGDADLSADGILTAAGGPVFMIYDGNRDGVPDREQPHVASVQALDGVSWLTLEAPDSSAIRNFSMKHLNNENQFEGFQPLYDCVDFTLDSIEVGSTVSVKLTVPDSVQMSRCFVLGKTDENSDRTWVDLFSGQANGSEISGNTITYNITEGGAIDADNSANGSLMISAVPLQAGGPSTGGSLASDNVYAYPNPFNPEIARNNIRYSLEEGAEVTIIIYDLGQKVVRKLLDKAERPAGTELSESWDGRNGRGDMVANGVYYFLIQTSTNQRALGKIALLR